MPIKIVYNLIASVIGVATFSGSVATTSAIISGTQVSTASSATNTATVKMEGEDAPVITGYNPGSEDQVNGDGVIDKINKMVDFDQHGDEEAEEYDDPRNSKKRMWEEPVARQDEL